MSLLKWYWNFCLCGAEPLVATASYSPTFEIIINEFEFHFEKKQTHFNILSGQQLRRARALHYCQFLRMRTSGLYGKWCVSIKLHYFLWNMKQIRKRQVDISMWGYSEMCMFLLVRRHTIWVGPSFHSYMLRHLTVILTSVAHKARYEN